MDPAHRALTPDIAEAASRLCYAEAIRSGTTSVMDMWRFLERSAAVADQLGLRATLVPYLCDGEGLDYFESLDSNRRLLDAIGTGGRVRAWVGLEHLLYCTPGVYRDARALADEYGTDIHTHSSEQHSRSTRSSSSTAGGPSRSSTTAAARGRPLRDRALRVAVRVGARPAGRDRHARGPLPVLQHEAGLRCGARPGHVGRGVTVGLGSDGEKENNNLDLLEEMKFASLLQKLTTLDPTTGNPWDVLAMATIEGARCLGIDAITGSLEPGKRADVVAVDLRRLHCTPLLHGADANVVEHLVFSANGADVDAVWVDGRPLVEAGCSWASTSPPCGPTPSWPPRSCSSAGGPSSAEDQAGGRSISSSMVPSGSGKQTNDSSGRPGPMDIVTAGDRQRTPWRASSSTSRRTSSVANANRHIPRLVAGTGAGATATAGRSSKENPVVSSRTTVSPSVASPITSE